MGSSQQTEAHVIPKKLSQFKLPPKVAKGKKTAKEENAKWLEYEDDDTFKGQKFYLKQDKLLAELESEYQIIKVIEHPKFQKTLFLDGCIQLSEYDEYLYHEMLTFLPLCCLDLIQIRALVVGGGDGGTARELLRDPRVSEITLVDIDNEVIETSKELLPFTGHSFNDERVKVIIADATEYIKSCEEGIFDIVLLDIPDYVENFDKQFYRNIKNSVANGGMVALQTYAPLTNDDELEDEVEDFWEAVDDICYGYVPVPCYPNGVNGILFGRVIKESFREYPQLNTPTHLISAQKAEEMGLRCYYDKFHVSACTLPLQFAKWFASLIEDSDNEDCEIER